MACQLRMDVKDEAGKHVFHAALTLVIEPARRVVALVWQGMTSSM
jgi:hypothetical protein